MKGRTLDINPRIFRVVPPLACLIYPALVSCISGVSPFFLIPVILVPLCCGYVAFHLAGTGFLKASAIAHFAIGAPALYSLMGQWLDSQKLFPFHANEAWVALWLLLTAISFFDKAVILSDASNSPVLRPSMEFQLFHLCFLRRST